MKREIENSIRNFLLEFVIYGVLVAAYYFVVLHFLGEGLCRLFQTERRIYAATALLLIVGQGLVLEIFTRALLGWIQPRKQD